MRKGGSEKRRCQKADKGKIAKGFAQQGHPLNKVLPLCGLSKSSQYYSPFFGRRGRKASTSTQRRKNIRYSNEDFLERSKWLLNQELIDYGYKGCRMAKEYEGLVINGWILYRVMKEGRLLNS
jgi:hypothetical protein